MAVQVGPLLIPEETFFDIVGATGAALILFGYYRISIGRWTNKSLLYELDNIVGPALVIFYSYHHRAYIGVILNLVWVAVAFHGLLPFAERYGRQLQKREHNARARAKRAYRRRLPR